MSIVATPPLPVELAHEISEDLTRNVRERRGRTSRCRELRDEECRFLDDRVAEKLRVHPKLASACIADAPMYELQ